MHKLATQDFAAVVTALRSQPDASSREQRAASRLEVGGRAMAWWMGPDGQPQPAVSVFIQDLSLTGIGLLCRRAVASGEAFVLGLPRGPQEPLLIGCEATRVTEIADGVFRVGARFVRTLARSTGHAAAAPAEPAVSVPTPASL